MPVDIYDSSLGWQELEVSGDEGGLKDNPKALGLKDGAMLAFRFKSEDDDEDELVDHFTVEWPSYDEQYGEEEQMEVDGEDDLDD